MSRRRLNVYYSSDEEQPSLQPSTLHPSDSNLNPNVPQPLPISDDDEQDFIDVSDHFSPPSPDSGHSLPHSPASMSSTDSPIPEFLRSLGLCLKREWLDACVRRLESSIPGFSTLNTADKAKLCFEQFLVSDMNFSGAGVLPQNLDSMHLVDLPGPYVLQVDEIVNISCPLKGRYQNAPAGMKRCLKLSMTDGAQRVFGMEYRPIKDLQVLAPAGLKVVICNASIRHGLLMLVPEAFEVLGGLVEELDAARQRLVDEVNKPPRGRRTRSGVVPPLASRATLAAWPSNSVREPGHGNTSVGTEHSRSDQGGDAFQRGNGTHTVPAGRANAHSEPSSNFVSNVEGIHSRSVSSNRAGTEANTLSDFDSTVEDTSMVDMTIEDTSTVDIEHPVILSGDRESPFTYLASLSAKWAAMKERSTSVQGKIKGFLTGVKGFQFQRRTTYELQVYIDDGSLISEALVDHKLVQKEIGHSPKDLTAALASSDTELASNMKETLKRFQGFLAKFEGTMLVEMNRTSPLPLILDMNLGCLESDAWSLLRRLKRSNAAQTEERTLLEPIDVSP